MNQILKKIIVIVMLFMMHSHMNISVAFAEMGRYKYNENGRLETIKLRDYEYQKYYDENGNLLSTVRINDVEQVENNSFEHYTGNDGLANEWGSYIDSEVDGLITV